MTRNNNSGTLVLRDWNENNLKHLARNNWRASLVPAAAVIPAPIAYIKVVAVKKLVVEPLAERCLASVGQRCAIHSRAVRGIKLSVRESGTLP